MILTEKDVNNLRKWIEKPDDTECPFKVPIHKDRRYCNEICHVYFALDPDKYCPCLYYPVEHVRKVAMDIVGLMGPQDCERMA